MKFRWPPFSRKREDGEVAPEGIMSYFKIRDRNRWISRMVEKRCGTGKKLGSKLQIDCKFLMTPMQLTDNQYIINTGNLPYKQGVVGSNPSAPTNIKIKEYNQKLYSFFLCPKLMYLCYIPKNDRSRPSLWKRLPAQQGNRSCSPRGTGWQQKPGGSLNSG